MWFWNEVGYHVIYIIIDLLTIADLFYIHGIQAIWTQTHYHLE